MDLPISVITWRLGHCEIDQLEKLIPNDQQFKVIMEKISKICGVFYLNSCQRIILALGTNNESIVKQVLFIYIRELLNTENYKEPEICIGTEAIRHLIYIISSLDSVVIGEDQIQHQFKEAYTKSEKYLNSSLSKLLQSVIRTGKRVRDKTLFKNGKISTVNLIDKLHRDDIRNARSIGIIGSGKVSQAMLGWLKDLNSNITIYSRKPARQGIDLSGFTVKDFSKLNSHDILFLATTSEMPIISNSIISKFIEDRIIIFDMGLPRNCEENVTDIPGVELYDMYSLLNISKNMKNDDVDYDGVFDIIDEEISKIINDFRRLQQNDIVLNLRNEIFAIAESKKKEIIGENSESEKEYDLLVKKIIHTSQKHLEKILLE